ncbi:MAG: sigma-54 dependent transcriptional regulator [Desulfobacterales bacterium]|nr:sigma-54 dependent transcriptional regulator [Desulfobacterales bacterium]
METPLIGISPSIEKVKKTIQQVAETCLNVVIYGESGVGKEVVARKLYEMSARNGNPFVKINAAALPETLFESELFGHEKGAFTGAERKKRGKFELAHKGVLMLDEISELPLPLQAKLLHVLQNGEYIPLGSEKEIKTDAWIISATNRDLKQAVKEGKFRIDLFYRLNIIKIHIPPLRERPEDILPLINYHLGKYSSELKINGFQELKNPALQKLMKYHWPGNVRELKNILRRFLIVNDWDQIVDELALEGKAAPAIPAENEEFPFESGIFPALLAENIDRQNPLKPFSLKKMKKKAQDRVEKELISYVLGKTGWNRSKAVDILNISYKTLLYKIEDLNLKKPYGSFDISN